MTAMRAEFGPITLKRGSSRLAGPNMCLMEAVAYFAGEPHSDKPQCVSRALWAFGLNLNDALSHSLRQELLPLIPSLIGTAEDGRDEARAFMAEDWMTRVHAPAYLDLRPSLTKIAAELRNLPPIVSPETSSSAYTILDSALEQSARDLNTIKSTRSDPLESRTMAGSSVHRSSIGPMSIRWANQRHAFILSIQAATAHMLQKDHLVSDLDPIANALQKSSIRLFERVINIGE